MTRKNYSSPPREPGLRRSTLANPLSAPSTCSEAAGSMPATVATSWNTPPTVERIVAIDAASGAAGLRRALG